MKKQNKDWEKDIEDIVDDFFTVGSEKHLSTLKEALINCINQILSQKEKEVRWELKKKVGGDEERASSSSRRNG